MKSRIVGYANLFIGSSSVLLLLISSSFGSSESEKQALEQELIAIGYVTDRFLFASILDRADYEHFVRENRGDPSGLYDRLRLQINKSNLLGERRSPNYPVGPTTRRSEGVPRWKMSYGNYWSFVGMGFSGGVERRRITEMNLYDPTNRNPEALQRQKNYAFEFLGVPATHFNPSVFVRREELMDYRFGDPGGCPVDS